jgi:1-acyl-sn-glycerol-3-phosphate acyltransferase
MTVVRTILFQIYFALMSVIVCLVWTPALLGPPGWSLKGVEFWGHLTLWGLKYICGLTYEVRGREHIQAAPCLYAGKHMAMWDTVVIPIILKHPALVLKRELLFIPFYGWYAARGGMIALDRSAHSSALRKLLTQARARLAEGRPVVIYPEGTRKKPGAAPDYKPGVAAIYGQLDVPCVPFALNSSLYWDGPMRRAGRIVIEFLPPIPPGLKRRPFMAELESVIETKTAELIAEARA